MTAPASLVDEGIREERKVPEQDLTDGKMITGKQGEHSVLQQSKSADIPDGSIVLPRHWQRLGETQ